MGPWQGKVVRPDRVLTSVACALLIVALVPAAPADELRYSVSFSEQDLRIEQQQDYDVVHLTDGGIWSEPGWPMLPTRTVRIALPDGMRATGLRVLGSETVTLSGQYNIYPAQPPQRISEPAVDFVEPDPSAYASAEAYPGVLAELKEQTDLAGQGMALVRFSPVQYVPATGTLTLHTSIEIAIDGVPGYVCGDYLSPALSEIERAQRTEQVREMVANPEAVAPQESPYAPTGRGVAAGDYDYVIITQGSWVDDFQPLADWKTKKGVPATIVTTDWIYGEYSGVSNPARIQAFIYNATSQWGTQFFLLGGDTNVIPYHTVNVGGDDIPNDTYYSDYDGDHTCEVHVGRAAVRSTDAVATFVNKALTYEKAPPLTNYAETATFLGFDLNSYGSGEGEDCKADIKTASIPMDWTYRSEYDSESGGHLSDSIGYLNQGNNLVNHIDHSGTDYMGMGYTNHDTGVDGGDMGDLTNGDRQSILYSIGCWACDYAANTCIAEAFVQNPNGGGVAFVGNSRYGWYSPHSGDHYSLRYDRCFFHSLLNEFHYRLGEAFSDHKNDAYETDETYVYIFEELTLLGDPELCVWTDAPQPLQVDHPAVIGTGGPTSFEVYVSSGGAPVTSARVCLWKNGDVYEVWYTSNGYHTFEIAPNFGGTLYVTATKRNYLPAESEAQVEGSIAYVLTTAVSGQGGITLDPPGGIYAEDTVVELTAEAAEGWSFSHWTGALGGSDNPETIQMDSDKSVTAVFTPTNDCNNNGIPDEDDIAAGTSYDCDGNGVPDECDIASGGDCNENGVPDACELGTVNGLAGAYYDQMGFTGELRGRIDAPLSFNWGSGEPWVGLGADTFSVRWTGWVHTPAVAGTYTFYTYTDDGVRLWVAGQLIIDRWVDQAPREWSGTIALEAEQDYRVVMEFYENGGGAVAELRWQPPGMSKVTIPAMNLAAGRDCNGNGIPDTCDIASGMPDEDGDGIPDVCEQGFLPGDLNGDLVVNNFDISPFVFAITHTEAEFAAQYPAGHYWAADVNGDETVNNFDISPFVDLLTGK